MATRPTDCSRGTISSTLVDDRHFFPPYEAAALVGASARARTPGAIAALTLLSGRLDEATMRGSTGASRWTARM